MSKQWRQCAECGFLAVRHTKTHELVEPDKGYRLCGLIPHKIWEIHPICFVGAFNLGIEEFFAIKGGESELNSVIEVTNKGRKCESFTEWQLGSTPKEHKEMLDRREWVKWQEKQRREDKRWRIIELIVLGIIAVIIAGAFTILGAFIERGSWP